MVPAANVAGQQWLQVVELHSDIADWKVVQLALGSAEHGDSEALFVALELASMTAVEVPDAAVAGGAVVGRLHVAVGMAQVHTAATAELRVDCGAVNIPADTEVICNTAEVAPLAGVALPGVGSTAEDEREDAVGAEASVAVAGSLCYNYHNVVLGNWNIAGYLAVNSNPASALHVGEEPVTEPGKGHLVRGESCRWPAAESGTGVDRRVSLSRVVVLTS